MSEGLETDFSRDEVLMSRFPVHRACRDGDVAALLSLSQQLSNPANLTAEDSCYGWTPIHWAAHYGQLECVVHLVQMGCGVNTATSRFNQTPTHTAALGGHPHCVVWLTQAGADVNRQDFVGEAPIHKAARSGSLECIQVLLIAGAKPHLRNASGQTASDLAHAHGFLDCSHFISKTRKHLMGNGAPCGQGLISRKRLLVAMDTGHMKKARGADDVQMQNSGGQQLESTNMELISDTNGHYHSNQDDPDVPQRIAPPRSPPANQHSRSPADMCGALHRTGSPSSCVTHRPAWQGLMGDDCRDFLYYGHYHGFGDTAEELSESSCLGYGSGVHLQMDS